MTAEPCQITVGDYLLSQDDEGRVTIWVKGRPMAPVFTGLERAMLDRIIDLERQLGLDLL